MFAALLAPRPTAGPSVADALVALNRAHRHVSARIDHLERRAAEERQRALTLHRSHCTPAAKRCLQRVHLYTQQAHKLEALQETLDRNIQLVDAAALTAELVGSLRQGAASLATLSAQAGDADAVREEIDAQMDAQRALDDALAAPLDPSAAMDEDELEAELAALELDAAPRRAPVAAAAAASDDNARLLELIAATAYPSEPRPRAAARVAEYAA